MDEGRSMGDGVLTPRELNRATLARQLLLRNQRRRAERGDGASIVAALRQIAGLQAQSSRAAFIGLWTRLPYLSREDIAQALHERRVVKATLMRGTIHLTTAEDYLLFRAAVQPLLTRLGQGLVNRTGLRLDVEELGADVRPFFGEPRDLADLRALLRERYPNAHTESLAYAIRVTLALIHAPRHDAPWAFPARPLLVDAEAWLGRPVPDSSGSRELILRYLAAFGPATLADVRSWSGLPSLRDEIAALRLALCVDRDQHGAELFDVPGAERPLADTPASPVLLPEWDNVLLAHADRTRVVPATLRKRIYRPVSQLIGPAVLVDGQVTATWKIERSSRAAVLAIEPLRRMTKAEREALAAEGERLARFIEPRAAAFAVRFDAVAGATPRKRA